MIVRELFARLGMQVDGSGFVKAQNALARLHLALGGLRDLANAAKSVLEDTANAARDAVQTSQITGMSAQRVQELGYAAQQSNVSAEELQHGLVHLARAAMEASQGGAEAAMGFQRIGVQVAGANGKARPLNDLLTEMSSRFAAMPDGTQKAALAMQVFGRAGARLIPLLDKGPAGIAALAEQARGLGVVMGPNAIATAERYRLTQLRFKAALEGLRNTVAEKLFPAFTDSAERMGRWIALHRQWIGLKVHQAFEIFRRVLDGVVGAGKRLAGVLKDIWNAGTYWRVQLIALGATVAAFVAPWTLLAAAIAVVMQDLEVFFRHGFNKPTVIGALILIFKIIENKIAALWDAFKKDPFGFLYDAATTFFDWFVEQANKLPERIGKNALGKLFGPAPSPIGGDSSGPGVDVPDASTGFKNMLWHMFGTPDPIAAAGGLPSWVPPLLRRDDPTTAGAPYGSSLTVNIGSLTVPASAADNPRAFADQIVRYVDEHWNGKMRESMAAVAR